MNLTVDMALAARAVDDAGIMDDAGGNSEAPGSFAYWWQRRGHWVEPLNQRRGGDSGVQRLIPFEPGFAPLYCKRQRGHLYRSLRYPLGRPTIWREVQAYHALARLGVATPRLIYGGIRRDAGQWQALLVTEELSGFVALDDWYQTAPSAPATRAVLTALAATLARLHRAGWRHGCCYPKHVFVRSDEDGGARVALLDLEKCRRVSGLWSRLLPFVKPPAHDMQQLARHRGAMPDYDWDFLCAQYRLQTQHAA